MRIAGDELIYLRQLVTRLVDNVARRRFDEQHRVDSLVPIHYRFQSSQDPSITLAKSTIHTTSCSAVGSGAYARHPRHDTVR